MRKQLTKLVALVVISIGFALGKTPEQLAVMIETAQAEHARKMERKAEERPRNKLMGWGLIAVGLAFLVSAAVQLSGCAGGRVRCRESATGRFVSCAASGNPVRTEYRGGQFFCVDAAGISWPSRGECD